MKHKWMCDVIGFQPIQAEEIQKTVAGGITAESLEAFIGNRGNLSTNVKEHIKALGYSWTDCGGGKDDWHIGVPFSDLFSAMTYLNAMTMKFEKAIAAGFLKFKLMSWSQEAWKANPSSKDNWD